MENRKGLNKELINYNLMVVLVHNRMETNKSHHYKSESSLYSLEFQNIFFCFFYFFLPLSFWKMDKTFSFVVSMVLINVMVTKELIYATLRKPMSKLRLHIIDHQNKETWIEKLALGWKQQYGCIGELP